MNPSEPIDRSAVLEANPGRSWEAEIRRDNSRTGNWQRSALLIGLGLMWGGITAFSQALEEIEAMIQGAALVLALLMGFAALGAPVWMTWLRSIPGVVLAAHVVVAILSGLRADCDAGSIVRYMALVPAFSLFLAVAEAGKTTTHDARLGVTWAGLLCVGFHLAYLEPKALLDPAYRITVFLNPNLTGFIAAMTGLSVLELMLRPGARIYARFGWLGSLLACGLLLFSTKSRTALSAFMMGVLVLSMVRFRARHARIAVGICFALAVAYGINTREFFVETLSLEDKGRSIETGTGRFEIWSFLLTEVWPNSPLLGIGPGQHRDLVFSATGSTSAHNGLLAALTDTGVLGAAPLVFLTLICAVSVWRRRHDPNLHWAAALFAAGVTESCAELALFNISNPASLLFLLSVATLAAGPGSNGITRDDSFSKARDESQEGSYPPPGGKLVAKEST